MSIHLDGGGRRSDECRLPSSSWRRGEADADAEV
jgi:hypothetical protein